MESALEALQTNEAGLNAAARQYNVPKATLKRRFDEKNKYATAAKKS